MNLLEHDPNHRRQQRLERIRVALREADCAALVCSRNADVLLSSGYLPCVGAAVAIATPEPRVVLLVPEDERARAAGGWADAVHVYRAASLDTLADAGQPQVAALSQALDALLPALGMQRARVACETGSGQVVSSYVAQSVLGGALSDLVRHAVPAAVVLPAAEMLAALRMKPTAWERARIRLACALAAQAYAQGALQLRAGMSEIDAALRFRDAYLGLAASCPEVTLADACFYCMSGPNAVAASAAFQQSGKRVLQEGEPILVHCNAHVDGYWTDLTRTYVLGAPDRRLAALMAALVRARQAALAAIRPGAPAAAVDRAARDVLQSLGHGAAFRHATGHGVGFDPIEHAERPRLHPCSTDVLEEGMVCNVEPGIYLPGYGGLRDCNMVAVTAAGHALLSPFQLSCDEWALDGSSRHPAAPVQPAGYRH